MMIGRVGGDAFADTLTTFLSANHVDTSGVVRVSDCTSGTALIVVDDAGENQVVVVPGANGRVDRGDVGAIAVNHGDVMICQFEVPIDVVVAALRHGREGGAVTILNPAPAKKVTGDVLALADVLVLNETELGLFADMTVSDTIGRGVVDRAIRAVRDTNTRQLIVVTLGARGAIVYSHESTLDIPGHAVDVVDTTAAGDCFVGSLGARMAARANLSDALRYANLAASICVQRLGAGPSIPYHNEVMAIAAW
jgi:ribokinase